MRSEPLQTTLALLAAFSVLFVTDAPAQTQSSCAYFTVVTQDRLGNIKQGLSADDVKWFQKHVAKKYPGACYTEPAPTVPVVFYITVTPAVYHGTRVVNQTSRHSDPVSGTVTESDGSTSQVEGTVETTTTSSTAVPYSFDYGIYTLALERRRPDGGYEVLHRFQQKGIYDTLYGIPLGGKGHHPVHTVIEDAAKWINSGGLLDPMQSALGAPAGASLPPKIPAEGPSSEPGIQDGPNAEGVTREAIEQGNASAQLRLGFLYYAGKGVPQDYAQAARLYRKAAEQGNADAQFNLGHMYDEGQGIPQDYAEAVRWYRKAADQGDAHAQNNLGIMYEQGNGLPQDYAEAVRWYRKAADQRNADAHAQHNLGFMYATGKGVPQDYAEAAIWYRKAAEQGNADAQFNLGALYMLGEGVRKDYSESYFWVKLAAGETPEVNPKDIRALLDGAASQLTPAALSQVQERVREWLAAHPIPQH